jgi:predicted Zn-dependent protease
MTSSVATSALAQGREGISFIRDTEIEHNIRHFATPVFEMAELDPESVKIYIVNDTTLNAYVAGGQKLFLHTGLLQRVERPSQLIGVIAHETGHIAGGHLSRTYEAMRNASAEAIVAMVLGGLIAAAGAPGPAIAVLSAGQHVAERSFLKYTRSQESAADQAAITFLNRTKQSSTGLIEFLDILGDQENLVVERQDPYVRTHPVSVERIQVLREQVRMSPFANQPDSPDDIRRLQRIQAKLLGYIGGLEETLKKYPVSDLSSVARYARAFAYYRQGNLPRMMSELDPLIAGEPNDPFYREIKGQALFEHGKNREAVEPAREAVKLAPREPLLRYLLGQILLGLEKPEATRDAIIHLEESARLEADSHSTWVLLAIAYGRQENFGMASLASAERFLLEGRKVDARGQAERAKRLLPPGAPAVLRAQDIIDEVIRQKKEESER